MKIKKIIIQTRLICTKCGNIQTIFRLANKTKKFGHLKFLWCFKCKERINHGLDPQHDIEKNKLLCEDYQKFLKKYDEGEQMKL